jgi:hypothetical protein
VVFFIGGKKFFIVDCRKIFLLQEILRENNYWGVGGGPLWDLTYWMKPCWEIFRPRKYNSRHISKALSSLGWPAKSNSGPAGVSIFSKSGAISGGGFLIFATWSCKVYFFIGKKKKYHLV